MLKIVWDSIRANPVADEMAEIFVNNNILAYAMNSIDTCFICQEVVIHAFVKAVLGGEINRKEIIFVNGSETASIDKNGAMPDWPFPSTTMDLMEKNAERVMANYGGSNARL
jgi:hypothetical protein